MKSFSESSISSRMLTDLQTKTDWSQIVSDGGTVSFIGSFSESEAEVVRYFEYLFKEGKWGHAQNTSSLVSDAKYLSYKPSRKVSALSTTGLIVSHDPTLASAGLTNIFSIADLTTYLSPYAPTVTQPNFFNIQIGDMFSTGTGINFFATASVPYVPSAGLASSTGTKYVVVPVMQGIRRSVSSTLVGNPGEQVVISSTSVETANNSISAPFLSVIGQIPGTSTTVNFVKYDSIYEANYDVYAYSVDTSDDFSQVIITFGNGVAGKVPPKGCYVTVNYVETLGSSGNITTNYTLNKVVSTAIGSSIPLYCMNVPESSTTTATFLGGSDEDTLETIRAKGPKAYITGGSLVTEEDYQVAVSTPNIPYIQKAVVFSGQAQDPATGNLKSVINYSAVQVDGSAPSSVDFPATVATIIKGKNSPLDTLTWVAPAFVHFRYNLWGKTSASTTNRSSLVSNIQSDLYKKLDISTQEFKGSFLKSSLDSYVQNAYSLTSVESMVEAITDLLPSSFAVDGTLPGYYSQAFHFDRSFVRLNNFNDKTLHCLKINIYFDCADCAYGANSFSRTLFLINDPTINPSYTVKFTAGTTAGNITVCGIALALSSIDVASASLIASKAITLTITNYTLTSPSPGVLVIAPANASVAPPSLAMGSTGVMFTRTATVGYKTVQYPYLSDITNYDYMSNFVLNTALSPNEIPTTDITTPYVPIKVDLDYNSLNPSDLDSTNLGMGTLRIPLYLFGTNATSGLTYINFAGANSIDMDAKIKIQVIGQVFDSKIESYTDNNILQVRSDYVLDDVVVELT